MKPIFNILFCLVCAFQLAAQRDSVTIEISTDTAAFEKQQFIDRYDYLAGTKEPLKRVLKWDALGTIAISRIALAGEFKLSKAFSVQGRFSWDFGNPLLFCDNCIKESNLTLGLEGRYYLGMARRIRKGKSANNMTGAYAGLEILETFDLKNNIGSNISTTARLGFQTRLFRMGYLDWSYGLGYQPGGVFNRGGVYMSSRVGIGLMFGTPKPAQTASYCEVLNCFREERSMFKIDLLNLVRLAPRYVGLNPNIAWESKLGRSAFSLNVEASVASSNYKVQNLGYFKDDSIHLYSGVLRTLSVYGSIQPRWYFLQKRRIAKGKDGNNLSGLYVSSTIGYVQTVKATPSEIYNFYNRRSYFNITPSIGYQQRLFKNLYVNYDWQLGRFFYYPKEKKWEHNTQLLDFFLFQSLKIGLAF